MKVVFLSSFNDLKPQDTGYSVRIFSLGRGLTSRGHEVHLVLPGSKSNVERIDGLIVHNISGLIPDKALNGIGRLLGISKAASLLFYDLAFIFKATQVLKKNDIVQIEQQTACGFLLPIITTLLKKPIVIDSHDVFQAIRVKHTTLLRRFLETFIEKFVYKFSDAILTVSTKESKILSSLGITGKRVEVIPNGVDTRLFHNICRTPYLGHDPNPRSPVVLFVGNLEYLPNQEAIHLIASSIAPKVRQEFKNATFLVVGRLGAIKYSNLTFAGSLKDIVPVLLNSDVAIAPLLQGSGTRLKILEYMSCGLPVVSTTIGVEGLEVKNGVHVLIEDEIESFSNAVIKLLRNQSLSAQLSSAARELVVKKYDWASIVLLLEKTYQHLMRLEAAKEYAS